MKKTRQFLFSFLAFVLLVWSGVVKGQVSSLPYQTDFSSQGDWVLDNGECTNIWHIGNATGYNSALYISDQGTTPHYDYNASSRVLAKKALAMGSSARVTIEFDAVVGSAYYEDDDYLKVFLVDEQTNSWYMQPSTSNAWGESSPFRASDYENAGYFNGRYAVSRYNGHVTMQVPNPAPNATAYLVFVWVNHQSYSESSVTQPAAVVQNLSVRATATEEVAIEPPTNMTIQINGIDSAYVSWQAGRDETIWQVKNGENASIIESYVPYYQFTGLENGGHYTFYIRAKQGDFVSEWLSQDFIFDIDPYSHTHGPDIIGETNARLTAAVDWKAFYPPTSYGQGCRRVLDNEWIITGVDSSYLWDVWGDDPERHVEIWSNVSNLQPFTWYNVVSWVVTQTGDTLWSSVDLPHQFCTADGNHFDPVTLPYTATFDDNDNWSLTYGYNNFYKGTPSGYSQNALFVSDNGVDAQYNTNIEYSNSFAKKVIKTGGVPYLKVEFDATVGGRTFLGEALDKLSISFASGDADVNHYWSSEIKDIYNESGHFVAYFHNENEEDTLSLMLQWAMENFLPSSCIVEEHDLAVVITNLTVSEASAEEVGGDCANVNYVSIYSVDENKFNMNWDGSWNCQVKLGEDGEVISLGEQSNYYFENLEPVTDYVAYIRKPCDETLTSYSDWMAVPFSTKFLPNVYMAAVGGITETSANFTAYIGDIYTERNPITGRGIQYRKANETTWESVEATSVEELYAWIGSVDVTEVFYANAASLAPNTTYIARAFVETQNGQVAYSEEREFYTSNVTGLAEVKENELEFKLYPNPANEQVNVVFSNLDERAVLSVFDLQGRLVAKQDITKGQKETRINVSNLNAGMYYIKLQGVKTNKVEKLIKK